MDGITTTPASLPETAGESIEKSLVEKLQQYQIQEREERRNEDWCWGFTCGLLAGVPFLVLIGCLTRYVFPLIDKLLR